MKINEGQIKKIAKIFQKIDTKSTLPDFTKPNFLFPPIAKNPEEYENIVNFFFATTVLNFGFWKSNKSGYNGATYEIIDGKKLKGSDILYAKAMEIFNSSPYIFRPHHLDIAVYGRKCLIPVQIAKTSESGSRMFLLRNYAQSFKHYQPIEILEAVNKSFNRLEEFRTYLKSITGYREDPLGKKTELLALFLACRPEKFLKVDIDDRGWRPITDYHWIRFALRTGMIAINAKTAEILKTREWTNKKTHDAIRLETYQANKLLKDYSGKNIIELDQYVWKFMRESCEENPQCQSCIFAEKCAKRIELFQPIYRTTYY